MVTSVEQNSFMKKVACDIILLGIALVFLISGLTKLHAPYAFLIALYKYNMWSPYTALMIADRKSTRLNSSHANISYAVFCLKKNRTHYFLRLRRKLYPSASDSVVGANLY